MASMAVQDVPRMAHAARGILCNNGERRLVRLLTHRIRTSSSASSTASVLMPGSGRIRLLRSFCAAGEGGAWADQGRWQAGRCCRDGPGRESRRQRGPRSNAGLSPLAPGGCAPAPGSRRGTAVAGRRHSTQATPRPLWDRQVAGQACQVRALGLDVCSSWRLSWPGATWMLIAAVATPTAPPEGQLPS